MFNLEITDVSTEKKIKDKEKKVKEEKHQTIILDIKSKRNSIIRYLMHIHKMYIDLKLTQNYITYSDIKLVYQFSDDEIDFIYNKLILKSKTHDKFSLPLAPSLCVFCLRYKYDCSICEYGVNHGECGFDENSTYMEILKGRIEIKNHTPVSNFWTWFTTFSNIGSCNTFVVDDQQHQRHK